MTEDASAFDSPGSPADAGTAAQIDRLRAELTAAKEALANQDARNRAEREREAQLRDELQHRARNTLALVRSVFARTIETGDTLEEVDSHFRGRLDALARYQGASRVGESHDLEDLIRNEFQDFRFGDLPKITIEGPDVRLSNTQTQPLALAIHELVTNSLKFGALSTEGAMLRLTWAVADDVLELTWAESGVAIVGAAPLRRGFSRQYIEDALPYQIGGETRFELLPGGILCLIHVPLQPRHTSGAPVRET